MAFIRNAAQLAVVLMVACAFIQIARAHQDVTKQPAGSNFCQGCKSTVSYLHRLNSTATRGAFRDAMMRFCREQYPAATDYRDGPCQYMVAKMFQTMDNINPASHCDQIGACGPAEIDGTTALRATSDQDDGDVVCNICVDTVNQFKESLTDPKNVNQIRDGIKQLCSYLNKIHQDQECDDLLNNQFDQLIQFVEHMNAKAYCAAVQLCPKKSTIVSSYFQDMLLPTLDDFASLGPQTSVKLIEPAQDKDVSSVEHKDAVPCMLCKTVIKQILPLINQNRTEESIEAALREVCQIVYKAGPKRKQCDEFVDRYADEIVKILIDESAPELVCMMLDLCTYDVPNRMSPVPAKHRESPPSTQTGSFKTFFTQLDEILNATSEACLECKLFIHFVKSKLSNVQSENELKNILENKICAQITDKDVAKTCRRMVEEYSGKIFEVIVHKLNGEEFCEDIEMCKPKPNLDSLTRNDNYCDTCESTVAYIDKLLATQSVDRDISHLVDTICNNFPNSNRNECRLIIDTFGPEILRAIGTMNSPKQLCQDIGLCPKSSNKHLLGAAKCSFGPGYWCQSSAHAKACAASDYCTRKVWKSSP